MEETPVVNNTPLGGDNSFNYETNSSDNLAAPSSPEKKVRKGKVSIIWKILIPLFVIFSAGAVYLALTTNMIPILQGNGKEEEIVAPVVIPEPEPINPVTTFESGLYKFSFDYNIDEHNLTQKGAFSTEPAFFMISGKNNVPVELEKEHNLEEGFLVKISVFEDIERNTWDLAERKVEKFKLECPPQKEIGPVFTSYVDGAETASFEVKNCNQDYFLDFVKFEGLVFEIAQVNRGDIGFRQQYKAETEEIVRSIKWLRALQVKPPTTSITNESFLVEIVHPWLDTSCCDVTKPSIEGLQKIAILTHLENGAIPASGPIPDKFGVFAVKKNQKSLELFVNEQKQALIQEYKVVEGKNPSGLSESLVNVGGKTGTKLQNYAWWGTVIYLDHADADAFLVFVIPNGVTKDFEVVIDGILRDVKFLENPKK